MCNRWSLPLILLLLAVMAPRPAVSGVPGPGYLVADLVEGTGPSLFLPRMFDPLDGRLYFVGRTTTTGEERWRTDGTAEGTELVADLCGGSCSSAGFVSEVFNGELYYSACTTFECTLWKTDGTNLLPIFEGKVTALAVWTGALYFATANGELRRTDGGGPGTLLHHFDDRGLKPYALLPAENAVFVVVADFSLVSPPPQLWRTDGTPAGTFYISELSWHLSPSLPLPFEGKLVFGVGNELWVSDSFGAEPLFDVSPFTEPAAHQAVSGVLLVHDEGRRLWRTDGTEGGTSLLAETAAYTGLRSAVFQGEFYFVLGAESGVLYRTVGLTGKTMVHEFPEAISSLRVLDGKLYAETGYPARELWEVSREPPPPDAVTQVFSLAASDSFAETTSWNDALYFDLTTSAGSELGRYTEESGVETLTQTGGGLSGDPEEITPHRDGVLFKLGPNAWGASDGTPHGTTDFPGEAFRTRIVSVGDEAFIQSSNAMLTVDPSGQLVQVFDAFSASFVDDVVVPTAHGILFLTISQDRVVDVWIGDRETGEKDLLREQIHVAPTSRLGSALYERLDDDVLLFIEGTVARTDGTAGGTVKIFDVALSSCDCLIYEAVRAGGYVYFAGSEAAGDPEVPLRTWRLWRTDGTLAGTSLVRAFPPDDQSRESYLRTLTSVGARVFFVMFEPATGEELWTSDGTPGGTAMVRDLKPGEGSSSNPRGLAVLHDRVYFTADDGAHGRELWVSDGTAPGTLLLADIAPGPRSSNARHLVAIDATLVFAADDGTHGLELWTSDGTAAGTSLRQDIQTGRLGSDPHDFTAAGDLVFFNAGRDDVGYELWALPRDALFEPPIFVDGFETGNTSAWSSTTQ